MATENAPASPPPVPVEQLQFRQAETVGDQLVYKRCALCKSPINSTYFQASQKDICPNCAEQIRSRQQAPSAHSLVKAAVYGAGASIAGCAIYATVAIMANLELALLAILIGFMVGKAIRHGSNGRGGRPQQILAVVFTYFAITFSYVVVYIYAGAPNHARTTQSSQTTTGRAAQPKAHLSKATVAAVLITLGPFLTLVSSPARGLISLLIIFFGLRRAWDMTGRSDILIQGPYNAAGTS